MKALLTIKNLRVSIEKRPIIRNLSLAIAPGEMHVVMGPNGSGKSTLAAALMGHPQYHVSAAKLEFIGSNLKKLTTDERARLGLFLGFQYPLAISGLSLSALLTESLRPRLKSNPASEKILHPTLASKEAFKQYDQALSLHDIIADKMEKLGMPNDMIYRNLNEGFSGGEKKKAEVLQMLALKPKLAILDEPDSGLDVDALKKIAGAINSEHKRGTAILLITHYERILKYLKPDKVHVMSKGKIVKSGGIEVAKMVEKKGYENITGHELRVTRKSARRNKPRS